MNCDDQSSVRPTSKIRAAAVSARFLDGSIKLLTSALSRDQVATPLQHESAYFYRRTTFYLTALPERRLKLLGGWLGPPARTLVTFQSHHSTPKPPSTYDAVVPLSKELGGFKKIALAGLVELK